MATKKTSKNSAVRVKPSAEAIRVVPLYLPKTELRLEELGKSPEDANLLALAPPATPPELVYNGGALIKNVKVFTIFWGKTWKSQPAALALIKAINAFFTAILASPLIVQLQEYSVPAYPIGYGSLIGTKTITTNAPVKSINDTQIQATLSKWISAGSVPAWDANTLYFIYLPQGVKVVMGGSSSCSSFCGYHNDINGKNYYAVMPFPSCAGCLGGMSILDALTGTSSHELCEAITDPAPPTGWYDNANGEIGDICAWKFKKLAGFNVQLEWSNTAGNCI